MTDRPAIEVDNATIRFGQFTAVDDVSLSVATGEVFGLFGTERFGQTTLIRALRPHPSRLKRGTLVGPRRQNPGGGNRIQTGYMSQKFSLYADLTAQEIWIYSGIYGLTKQQAKEREEELIEMMGSRPISIAVPLAFRVDGSSGSRWSAPLHRPRLVFSTNRPPASIRCAPRSLDLLFRLPRKESPLCHHALHGRSWLLRPRRLPLHVEAVGDRHA